MTKSNSVGDRAKVRVKRAWTKPVLMKFDVREVTRGGPVDIGFDNGFLFDS